MHGFKISPLASYAAIPLCQVIRYVPIVCVSTLAVNPHLSGFAPSFYLFCIRIPAYDSGPMWRNPTSNFIRRGSFRRCRTFAHGGRCFLQMLQFCNSMARVPSTKLRDFGIVWLLNHIKHPYPRREAAKTPLPNSRRHAKLGER